MGVVPENFNERREDLGSDPPEFLAMGFGESLQQAVAVRRHLDQDLPAVGQVAAPPDHALPLEASRQLDDAVVAELELPGQSADRGRSIGEPLHGQEQLVLLGLQALFAGGALTEDQEAADQMPILNQFAEIPAIQISGEIPIWH